MNVVEESNEVSKHIIGKYLVIYEYFGENLNFLQSPPKNISRENFK